MSKRGGEKSTKRADEGLRRQRWHQPSISANNHGLAACQPTFVTARVFFLHWRVQNASEVSSFQIYAIYTNVCSLFGTG